MITAPLAVLLFLKTSAELEALVGARIYQMHAPENPDYPFVVVQLVAEPVPYHLRGPAGLVTSRVQVDCYAASSSAIDPKWDVDLVAAAADEWLSGATFAIGSPTMHVRGVFRVNRIDFDEDPAELGISRVMLDYAVWNRPPAPTAVNRSLVRSR